MRNAKLIVCLWLLLSGISNIQAQKVFGRVVDASSEEPLVGVSVYFDGSRFGTTTSEDGSFEIETPYTILSSLIFSHIGYETLELEEYYKEGSLWIKLKAKTEVLDEVVVTSDPFSRRQKMEVFRLEFLGDDRYGRHCEILNEEVISLYFDSSTNMLTASATAPIMVRNDYLSYLIEFDLQEFEVYFKSRSLVRLENVFFTYLSGFSRFIDNDPESKRISRRRFKAYLGSPMHLMRSIYRNQLTENGFRFRKEYETFPSHKIFQRFDPDSLKLVEIQFLQDDFDLTFSYGLDYESALRILGDRSIKIDPYGTHRPYKNIVFRKYMSGMRTGRLLPIDYMPPGTFNPQGSVRSDHHLWGKDALNISDPSK